MVNSDDDERKPKRHKTLRACDRCRDKKLGCRFSQKHENGKCDQCHEASTSCEFLAPAKIDKRRLQVMLERAVTDEDKKKLAEMVAERGVYLPKTGVGRAGRSDDGSGSGIGGSARKKRRISEKSGSRTREGEERRGLGGTESERSSMEAQSLNITMASNPPYPYNPEYAQHPYHGPAPGPMPPTGYYPPHPDEFTRNNGPHAGPSRLPDGQGQQERYVAGGPGLGGGLVRGPPEPPAQTVLKTTGVEPRML